MEFAVPTYILLCHIEQNHKKNGNVGEEDEIIIKPRQAAGKVCKNGEMVEESRKKKSSRKFISTLQ